MILVSIDPGYAARGKGCACAVFSDARLIRVMHLRPETASHETLMVHADDVVWECPQLDNRTRHSASSVITLAAVGGVMAGMFAGANGARVHSVTPTQWKGSTPKPIMHRRMWADLDDDERAVLGGETVEGEIIGACLAGARDRWGKPGASYYRPTGVHDLLDAVGIGIWWLREVQ